MEHLFGIANIFAAAGWLLLVAAPRWHWTERLVLSGLWSIALAVVYTTLLVLYLPQGDGGFGSIGEVRQLFSHDGLLAAGWVHYLSFDLLIGAVEVRQANAQKISRVLMTPILIATFLLGPLGLLAFFVMQAVRERRLPAVVP